MVIVLSVTAVGACLARSGDVFLSFVSDKLEIDTSYQNHSGFVSCFLLRFIELQKASFIPEKLPLELSCEKAFVQPDFSELLKQGSITLTCSIRNAVFSEARRDREEADGIFSFFHASGSEMLKRIAGCPFENIYTRLFLHGDTVEFLYFVADSRDIKIYGKGSINRAGDLKMSARVFLSEKIAGKFSNELRDLFTPESSGWLSYGLNIEKGESVPFLKVDSDRFSINFQKVGVQ